MSEARRRVIDRVSGELGTVIDSYGEGSHRRYRIAWDNPTPNQDRVWVRVPGRFFDWHEEQPGERVRSSDPADTDEPTTPTQEDS